MMVWYWMLWIVGVIFVFSCGATAQAASSDKDVRCLLHLLAAFLCLFFSMRGLT